MPDRVPGKFADGTPGGIQMETSVCIPVRAPEYILRETQEKIPGGSPGRMPNGTPAGIRGGTLVFWYSGILVF